MEGEGSPDISNMKLMAQNKQKTQPNYLSPFPPQYSHIIDNETN